MVSFPLQRVADDVHRPVHEVPGEDPFLRVDEALKRGVERVRSDRTRVPDVVGLDEPLLKILNTHDADGLAPALTDLKDQVIAPATKAPDLIRLKGVEQSRNTVPILVDDQQGVGTVVLDHTNDQATGNLDDLAELPHTKKRNQLVGVDVVQYPPQIHTTIPDQDPTTGEAVDLTGLVVVVERLLATGAFEKYPAPFLAHRPQPIPAHEADLPLALHDGVLEDLVVLGAVPDLSVVEIEEEDGGLVRLGDGVNDDLAAQVSQHLEVLGGDLPEGGDLQVHTATALLEPLKTLVPSGGEDHYAAGPRMDVVGQVGVDGLDLAGGAVDRVEVPVAPEDAGATVGSLQGRTCHRERDLLAPFRVVQVVDVHVTACGGDDATGPATVDDRPLHDLLCAVLLDAQHRDLALGRDGDLRDLRPGRLGHEGDVGWKWRELPQEREARGLNALGRRAVMASIEHGVAKLGEDIRLLTGHDSLLDLGQKDDTDPQVSPGNHRAFLSDRWVSRNATVLFSLFW